MRHWIPLCLAIILLLPITLWSVSQRPLTQSPASSKLSDNQMDWLSNIAQVVERHNKDLSQDWQKAYAMLGNSASQWHNSTWVLNKMHRYGLWQNGIIPKITDANLTELLKRMAPVPTSIVLAQAIISSNWGGTEQAKLANNLFNVVCFSPDCGMNDHDLPAHSQWRIFNSKSQAIKRFIEVDINTDNYESFHDQRFKMLQKGVLMNGPWYYKSLPKSIRIVIADYQLADWDRPLLSLK